MRWPIELRRNKAVAGAMGNPDPMRTEVIADVFARKIPIAGTEKFTGAQRLAEADVAWEMWWEPAAALGFSTKDWIRDPESGEFFDVIEIQEVGYHEGMRVLSRRRAVAALAPPPVDP